MNSTWHQASSGKAESPQQPTECPRNRAAPALLQAHMLSHATSSSADGRPGCRPRVVIFHGDVGLPMIAREGSRDQADDRHGDNVERQSHAGISSGSELTDQERGDEADGKTTGQGGELIPEGGAAV